MSLSYNKYIYIYYVYIYNIYIIIYIPRNNFICSFNRSARRARPRSRLLRLDATLETSPLIPRPDDLVEGRRRRGRARLRTSRARPFLFVPWRTSGRRTRDPGSAKRPRTPRTSARSFFCFLPSFSPYYQKKRTERVFPCCVLVVLTSSSLTRPSSPTDFGVHDPHAKATRSIHLFAHQSPRARARPLIVTFPRR